MQTTTRTRPIVGRAVPITVTALVAAAFAVRLLAVPSSDAVAPDEILRRRAALPAELPLKLAAVTDAASAIAAAALPLAERDAMLAAVGDGRLRLAWLDLFDSDAVDGDRVTVQGLGLAETLTLGRAPIRVLVPLPADRRLRLTGVDEGRGGGVTVGVMSDGQPIKLPPLAVGTSLELTVVARR